MVDPSRMRDATGLIPVFRSSRWRFEVLFFDIATKWQMGVGTCCELARVPGWNGLNQAIQPRPPIGISDCRLRV